jgi:hypothetical protein
MKKECQGCYLVRNTVNQTLGPPIDSSRISCGIEDLDCPCKTCLVKITCDIIENSTLCEPFQTFHLMHGKGEYWENRRKENVQIPL